MRLALSLLLVPLSVPADSGLVEEGLRVVHDWRGDAAGEQFGWVAQPAGDLDGDGVLDVVTSAPFRALQGGPAGRVLAYSGKTGELLHELAGEAGEQLGRCVGGLGDVDGDGRDDFAAGAPARDGGAGRVYVWSGSTGEVLLALDGPEPGGAFGSSLAALGDLDGDGHADLVTSAPSAGPGLVFALSGADGAELFVLEGERDGDLFGSGLGAGEPAEAGAARTLVVGARDAGEGRRGGVSVFDLTADGAEPRFTFRAEPSGVDLGRFFVSVVGDVDGDGREDVYAADFADTSSRDEAGRAGGRVYVHSGADGARLFARGAFEPGEGFGIGDARVGDVNGDGHADLAIGAWTSSAAAPGAGRTYLVSGADFAVLATVTSDVAGEAFGFDSTGLGDLDGDGTFELLLTGAYHPEAGPQTGRVVVVSVPVEAAR